MNENKENISNKTTNITNSSTDTQYPSAKAVYDLDVGIKNDFHSFGNNNNTNYYIKFLRIVYSGSYIDSGISFTIHQRTQPPTNITFTTQWDSTNQKYNIGNLYYDGYPRAIYVYRSAKNTFDFYINPGAWGTYGMSPIKTNKTRIDSFITVTKLSELSDSLPTSTTDNPLLQATLNPYYSPVTHNHTKSQITDFPITMTPTDESVTRNKLGSDIQISGANLLTLTQLFNSPITATPGASSLNGTSYYGCNVRYLKNTGSSYIDFMWNIPYEQLESNGYYTLSFWAKATTAHDYVYTYFYLGNVNTKRIKSNTTVSGYSGNGSFGDGSTRFALSTGWKRYYVVYQLNNTAPGTANKNLTIRLNPNTSNPYDIYLAGVKFEKGTIPTEWSPHPNDWNEIPMSGSVTATDMATNQELNPNRLAYLPGNNITVEYSLNNGSTWTDYGASVDDKSRLVTSSYIFKAGKDETASASHQLRVTINAGGGNNTASNVYLFTRKLMIFFTSGATANTKVQVETSTYSNPTTWNNIGTYRIAGNSGWNSIPLAITLGGAASQTTGGRIQNIRLTFSTDMAYKFNVSKIRLYGENCWLNPSNLANNGHMYSYDINKNVTFPGTLTATKIINSSSNNTNILLGNGNTLAYEQAPVEITYVDGSKVTKKIILLPNG